MVADNEAESPHLIVAGSQYHEFVKSEIPEMARRILAWLGLLASVLIPGTAHSQEFKLPSLIPFKKQTHEVKPIQLTDQAEGQFGVLPGRPLMNFLHPAPKAGGSGAEGLTQKSKNFFVKSGESISHFAAEMRDSMKNIESPGWQFSDKGPWWNEHPDSTKLYRDLNRLNWNTPQPMLPPQPAPRTAQGLPSAPPKYRF
jgi:hypothetical protein